MSLAEIVDSQPFEYPEAHLELMRDFPDTYIPPAVLDDAAERIFSYRAAKANRNMAFEAEEARLKGSNSNMTDVLGEVLLMFSETYLDVYGNTIPKSDREKREQEYLLLNELLLNTRTVVVRH